MMAEIKNGWKRTSRFVTRDVWELDIYSLSGLKRQGVSLVRIIQMVGKGFREDQHSLHASALTFTTLMSLVPFLALSFAIFKGLSADTQRLESIRTISVDTAVVAAPAIGTNPVAAVDGTLTAPSTDPAASQDYADKMVHRARSAMAQMPPEFQKFVENNIITPLITMNTGALGGLGLMVFLFTIVKVLSSIEHSFNTVWGVTEPRPLLRKFTDYISTMVIVPFMIIAAGTISSSPLIDSMGEAGVYYQKLLKFSGFFTTWLAFTFLYMFMPNTRVNAGPALLGGLLGTIFWVFWQKLYITLQVGVVRQNIIFGTFATVPIFLAWLYVSWVIVLLGAEISFALQHNATYLMEQKSDEASPTARLKLALAVVMSTAESMLEARPMFSVTDFARQYRVPVRLLNQTTHILKQSGLLAEISEPRGSFVLTRSPDQIQVSDVVHIIMEHGSRSRELGLGRLDITVEEALESIGTGVDQQLAQRSIRDLVTA